MEAFSALNASHKQMPLYLVVPHSSGPTCQTCRSQLPFMIRAQSNPAFNIGKCSHHSSHACPLLWLTRFGES